MSRPTAERQIEFILDHILEWRMEPRPPGSSFCTDKVCVLRVTPYVKQEHNRATREIILAVLNRCIAIEDEHRERETQ